MHQNVGSGVGRQTGVVEDRATAPRKLWVVRPSGMPFDHGADIQPRPHPDHRGHHDSDHPRLGDLAAGPHRGRWGRWCGRAARDGALRACHGLDVPFTFDTPHGPLAAQLIGPEIPPDFGDLSAAMRNAFIAFATTGDPGWPRFDTTERIRRIWAAPPELGSDTLPTSRRIWERDRVPGRPSSDHV
ncbi:hypothetical protein [Nocardia sp. MDA0666]|uniref:hypothetical protein n=1 Tax=Nocardia sp. MDA0666 TaxID=2135448 RepID=UPI001304C6E7